MLHTISGSNIDVELVSETDVVLFWQDGVILALKSSPILSKILAKTAHCYVLDNDLIARGLTSLVDDRVQVIAMSEVVKLTGDFFPQMKWG
ncbi:sulfurtransferase complex subunit TusB [Orbaceae bacterium ac157xtp]